LIRQHVGGGEADEKAGEKGKEAHV
jgi:hypothetical protein